MASETRILSLDNGHVVLFISLACRHGDDSPKFTALTTGPQYMGEGDEGMENYSVVGDNREDEEWWTVE